MYGIIDNEDQWNKIQVRFLEKHMYFTRSAKKLRKAKKGPEQWISPSPPYCLHRQQPGL